MMKFKDPMGNGVSGGMGSRAVCGLGNWVPLSPWGACGLTATKFDPKTKGHWNL